MFRRLLKHDFRACLKQLRIYYGITTGLTLITSIALLLAGDNKETLFWVAAMFAFALSVIAIFALLVITLVILFKYYYDSFFKDAAYLFMTIPVRMEERLLSKLVSFLFLSIFSLVIVCVCFFVLLGAFSFGDPQTTSTTATTTPLFGEFFTALNVAQLLLLALLTAISSILTIFCFITISQTLFEGKYRILFTIILYFAYQSAVSNLSLIPLGLIATYSFAAYITASCLWNALLCAIFFYLNRYLLTQKYNLQ